MLSAKATYVELFGVIFKTLPRRIGVLYFVRCCSYARLALTSPRPVEAHSTVSSSKASLRFVR